ncbi:hypothetical protein MPER_01494 [Moniliophthora perniciosa FA553]|nr:hypothetical protein MPER_01494 [Moniliophthora perniciosa FA553]
MEVEQTVTVTATTTDREPIGNGPLAQASVEGRATDLELPAQSEPVLPSVTKLPSNLELDVSRADSAGRGVVIPNVGAASTSDVILSGMEIEQTVTVAATTTDREPIDNQPSSDKPPQAAPAIVSTAADTVPATTSVATPRPATANTDSGSEVRIAPHAIPATVPGGVGVPITLPDTPAMPDGRSKDPVASEMPNGSASSSPIEAIPHSDNGCRNPGVADRSADETSSASNKLLSHSVNEPPLTTQDDVSVPSVSVAVSMGVANPHPAAASIDGASNIGTAHHTIPAVLEVGAGDMGVAIRQQDTSSTSRESPKVPTTAGEMNGIQDVSSGQMKVMPYWNNGWQDPGLAGEFDAGFAFPPTTGVGTSSWNTPGRSTTISAVLHRLGPPWGSLLGDTFLARAGARHAQGFLFQGFF